MLLFKRLPIHARSPSRDWNGFLWWPGVASGARSCLRRGRGGRPLSFQLFFISAVLGLPFACRSWRTAPRFLFLRFWGYRHRQHKSKNTRGWKSVSVSYPFHTFLNRFTPHRGPRALWWNLCPTVSHPTVACLTNKHIKSRASNLWCLRKGSMARMRCGRLWWPSNIHKKIVDGMYISFCVHAYGAVLFIYTMRPDIK